MKNHYQKAADEILKAVRNLVEIVGNPNQLEKIDLRKGKKLIIEMLITNFTAKKKKWR